jgi:hypothetical protein
MSRYTAAELDAFALDDLRRDAESCERQAVDGPFYPDRDITAESLLRYAASCRETMARHAKGGAHAAVHAGILKPKGKS